MASLSRAARPGPPAERHVDRWGTIQSRHLIVEPTTLASDEPGDRVFDEVSFRIDPRAVALARRIDDELRSGDDLARLSAEALEETRVRDLERVCSGGRSLM